jgi:hypothetical protein
MKLSISQSRKSSSGQSGSTDPDKTLKCFPSLRVIDCIRKKDKPEVQFQTIRKYSFRTLRKYSCPVPDDPEVQQTTRQTIRKSSSGQDDPDEYKYYDHGQVPKCE